MPAAPVIEMTGFIGIAPLDHGRIFTALVGEISARLAGDLYPPRRAIDRVGVLECFLETWWGHELIEIIGCVDDHQHANAFLHHGAQPACKEGHMKNHDQVNLAQCLQSALALAYRGHTDLGPRRHRVHAHLVDVSAELISGSK